MTPTPKVTFSDQVVSSEDASLVNDVESVLEPKILAMLSDRPTIAEYAKTLIAHEMAHEASSVIRDAHYVQLDANQLLTTVRRILSVINALEISKPDVWARDHPQRDDQTGLARIDEITSRRVLYVAHSHVKRLGSKHTSMFGRSFLIQVWPEVVSAINATRSAASVPDDPLTYVMSLIEKSLSEENSLVWTKDLRVTLHLRNEERKRVAAERVQKELMDGHKALGEAVSAAFAGQSAVNEGEEEEKE